MRAWLRQFFRSVLFNEESPPQFDVGNEGTTALLVLVLFFLIAAGLGLHHVFFGPT